MTHGTRQRREHALEWIAAGLVAFFIFAGIAFYSFSVDVRSVSAPTQSTDGKAHHRIVFNRWFSGHVGIQVCCSQEVQAASSRCLHATLSSSSTTPVVKDPMPDSSGEGRVRLPEREGT